MATLPRLRDARCISIDTETRDPDLEELGPGFRRGARVVGCSIGIDGGPRFYLPWGHEGGGNLERDKCVGYLRSELAEYAGDVVGAYLLYDLDGLAADGIRLPKVRRFLDVGNAEPLLDEHKQGHYNLDELSLFYLGEGKDQTLLRSAARAYNLGKTDKEIKRNLWRLPAGMVGPYAESDVDRPLRILPLQLQKLEREELLTVWDIECRLIPLLLEMRLRGVRIDMARLDEVRAALAAKRDEHLAELKRLAGPSAELMAAESLGPALEARGLDVPRTQKRGMYSITKDWLTEHAGDAMVDHIREGRRYNTVVNTFMDGGISTHVIGGRIHTTFNQLKKDEGGTIARFSSQDPNLQNIPARDEELAPLMRGMFLPEEDEDWESQDQKQAEYRFQAHYAIGVGADEFRMRYINDPDTDYHSFCGELLHWDVKNKFLRKVLKSINFAKGYGARARKLAFLITIATGKKCTVEKAQEFMNEHERAMPFTVATFDSAARIADRQGYIKSLLGRRGRFPLWEPEDNKRKEMKYRLPAYPKERAIELYGTNVVRANTYTALNNLLQFCNADVMKKAMVDIAESGTLNVLGAPLLTVHDELCFSKPRTSQAEEAAAECARLTEIAIPIRVPFLVDRQSGANWGEC